MSPIKSATTFSFLFKATLNSYISFSFKASYNRQSCWSLLALFWSNSNPCNYKLRFSISLIFSFNSLWVACALSSAAIILSSTSPYCDFNPLYFSKNSYFSLYNLSRLNCICCYDSFEFSTYYKSFSFSRFNYLFSLFVYFESCISRSIELILSYISTSLVACS